MDRADIYAESLLALIGSEDSPQVVVDELYQVAQAFESSDDLRSQLSDQTVPAPRRQQIIEQLLGQSAHPVTTAVTSLIVGAGRANEFPRIAKGIVERSATAANKSLAEVRSAVPLSTDQQARLAAALERKLGHPVDVKVTIDPSVVGGVVTQIGDTVIDGSVRSRLTQLREVF